MNNLNGVHNRKDRDEYYTLFKDVKKELDNYDLNGLKIVCPCDGKDNFQAFYDWAVNNGYSDNLTIDRIDVNGNYEPNNCRFVNMKQQERNKRNNRNITINGEMHCLKEWCELLGLNYQTVFTRIYRGWSIERALELEEK